jgi:hypothetical protein
MTALESYPGLHPGTGTNDHMHHWQLYSHDGGTVRACTICGALHPYLATVEQAEATVAALDEYDRTGDEDALRRALAPPNASEEALD